MEITNNKFNELSLKADECVLKNDSALAVKLAKEIRSAELYDEITNVEAAFLIDRLPLDVDESLDTYRPEEITSTSGGIKIDLNNTEVKVRSRVPDELDDFEDDKEETESGFNFDLSFESPSKKLDKLDDFEENDEEEDEEEEESGFFGMIGL